MTGLRPDVARFLEQRYPGASVKRLAGDGSTRSFLRVAPGAAPSVVVMDYGQAVAGPTDDERLAHVFIESGLPVARVLGSHPELGILLLEDVGD